MTSTLPPFTAFTSRISRRDAASEVVVVYAGGLFEDDAHVTRTYYPTGLIESDFGRDFYEDAITKYDSRYWILIDNFPEWVCNLEPSPIRDNLIRDWI